MEKLGKRSGIDWTALWILFSGWCSFAGWVLSWLGCLNRWGYAIAFALFLGGLIIFRKQFGFFGQKPVLFRVNIIRSRWLLPKIWLMLASLVFIGGLIYHPSNYDYLTYRFPRVLHWCWDQKWNWIQSINVRMNYSAIGIEWLMTPLFVFFKTDRLFFLINFISFLLLPGLVFSVFSNLGISKRVSWWWMWVLPCGYCYLLQAGSAGNDSFTSVYLLASLHYAFKAKESFVGKNLALSCLSIALLTGAKVSNIPLALPWLATIFFNRKFLLEVKSPFLLVGTLLVAAIVSFLPVALLNIHYSGDYTGDPANKAKFRLSDPVSGIAGNSLQITVDNLAPPVWPKPIPWGEILPAKLKARIVRGFPRFNITTGEIPMEEITGVGLGVTTGVGIMAGFGLWALLARKNIRIRRSRQALWITAGAGVALMVYMSKMGGEAASRLVIPYYPLLIAGVSVLVSLDGCVMKRSLFRVVGSVAMLSALPVVIFNPARPLFPVDLTARYLARVAPSSSVRFNQVYEVYSSRFDALRDLRTYLPRNEDVVGFLQTGDDPETSLWRPFGSRQVLDVTPGKSVDELKAKHLHFIVVDGDALEYTYHIKIDDLLKKWSASIVTKKYLLVKASMGPRPWYILHCP